MQKITTLACLFFIAIYQRWISPLKGFSCAHYALYGEATCSNAIKALILEHGLFAALPRIRSRFDECHAAVERLQAGLSPPQSADLPCDLPCDISFGDCGASSDGDGGCVNSCHYLGDCKQFSKRTERMLMAIGLSIALALSYVYYGRDINAIYIIDKGEAQQNLVDRLVQRDHPQVRALLVIEGRKIYSEIVEFEEYANEYKLILDSPISNFVIDRLEIQDARLNVAAKLVVVGQVLEVFKAPIKEAEGIRFAYRLKRRWHFK